MYNECITVIELLMDKETSNRYKIIKKGALVQFLICAPEEIEVDQLLALIQARATIRDIKGNRNLDRPKPDVAKII